MLETSEWYHTVRNPAGLRVHRLRADLVEARMVELRDQQTNALEPPFEWWMSDEDLRMKARGEMVEADKITLGFPPFEEWYGSPLWDSALAPGEPHHTIMDQRLNVDVDVLV